MAYFRAVVAFDVDAFNMNAPILNGDQSGLIGHSQSLHSHNYPDAYYFRFHDSANTTHSDFSAAGTNITQTLDHSQFASGTVEGLFLAQENGSGASTTYDDQWYVQGVKINASDLSLAMKSADTADDYRLLVTALGGSDTFDLSPGNDVMHGYGGNDVINGYAGNDKLYGDSGKDTIYGGDGDDRIHGGSGNDKLYGGAGKDDFVFDTTANSKSSTDRIQDFRSVDDTIDLARSVFTKLKYFGQIHKANIVIGKNAVAHDSNDYIIYQTNTGKLYYDSNGSAHGGMVLIATISGHPTLHLSDFMVF